MRVAIIGRTRWLIDAADACLAAGHDIVVVATSAPASFYKCNSHDFLLLAERAGADYLGEVSLSRLETQTQLKSSFADIAISVNWPSIINADVIDLFPHGVLNAHCGDLPRYRGNACPNWAILNGEPQIGLCIHKMVANELDSGPIVVRDYLPTTNDMYIGDVYDWLNKRIPELFAAALDGLASGCVKPVPQPLDPGLALRCYPRRAEDGLIDWSLSAEYIHRLVRSSSHPFDGAFTYLEDGRKVKIWRASLYRPLQPFCAIPGQIILSFEGDLIVATGSGALRVEDVEIDDLASNKSKILLMKNLRSRFK